MKIELDPFALYSFDPKKENRSIKKNGIANIKRRVNELVSPNLQK